MQHKPLVNLVLRMQFFLKFLRKIALLISIIIFSLPTSAQGDEDTNDSLQIYYLQSFNYYSQDSFNLSFNSINSALQFADSTIDRVKIARLYGLKGYIYLNRGAKIKAIESFSKSKRIGVLLNDLEIQIAGLHGLGRVYITLGETDKAYNYLLEGLKLAEGANNKHSEAVLNNALGILEQDRDSFYSALNHFIKFDKISSELNDTLSAVYASVNIGEIYINLGIIDSALYYIKKAESLNLYANSAQARAAIFGNYGRIMNDKGDFLKSIEYINRSMKICYNNNFSDFIIENYSMLIKDYQAIHDLQKSIKLYKELDSYKDSLYRINDLKRSKGLESQLLLEEKAAKALYWQQKYNNRNLILALSVTISILIIVFLFMLSKRYKANKKKHREETRNLTQTIDEKNRELVTRIMSENQRESTLGELSNTLEYISKENDVEKIKQHLNQALRNISSSEFINNNWGVFKVHFEKVHPNFFVELLKIQPKLTQSELRLCAYIKMNLTTKEIANLTNISDRSIQTNRYRLKKKLELDPNTNLISFIQSF